MDSLTFTPGRAHLASNSLVSPWCVVFEDEGPAGYGYACDLSRGSGENTILDSMLIYTGSALEPGEHLAAIQWSRDGLQAVLYIDGTPQAFVDFAARQSFCRANFPNFLDTPSSPWRTSTHAWNDEALQRFESALYVN